MVKALSAETDSAEIRAWREWLSRYVDCFAKLVRESIENLAAEDVQEYLAIGQLEIKSPEDRKLLQSWFSSLCNAIRDDRHGEEKIVAVLEQALLRIDKSVFKANPRQLVRLANCLLSKLDPTKTPFTKGFYASHINTLSALHQTFVALQQVEPRLFDPESKSRIYQQFKSCLKKIKTRPEQLPIPVPSAGHRAKHSAAWM